MFSRYLLESKMQTLWFRWSINIFLAWLIFCLAEFGGFLGINNLALPISIVWPATGISLASVLLFGFKTWPGIFVGNFCYNFLHLFLQTHSLPAPFLASLIIALGSLFQALLGATIIKQLSSPNYFSTVRDILIFLLPAGLVTCLVASTVGVSALYFYHPFSVEKMIQTWITFWLGDTTGVYIFTPLLVVWLTYKPTFDFRNYAWEAYLMVIYYLLVFFFAFVWNFPLALLFIPLSLWITCRFRMHGATLAIAVIILTTAFSTFLGYGTFVFYLTQSPIVFLVTYLMVIIATCLLLAAVINEKEEAWNLLQDYNKDLQNVVQKHNDELKEILNEIYIKEKLASLGMLAAGLGREIKTPLTSIENYIKASLDCINLLQKMFSGIKGSLDSGVAVSMRNNFEILENCLHTIGQYEKQADKIVSVMQEQATHTNAKIEVKSINLHTLLNQCLNKLIGEKAKKFPELAFTVIKEFDKEASVIIGFPEDLTHAFLNILEYAFYSIQEKNRLQRTFFEPTLKIKTTDLRDSIEITIQDNGMGFAENKLPTLFESFGNTKVNGDPTGIGLSLAYDIIVNEHHGDIQVASKESAFLKWKIKLPKSPVSKKRISHHPLITR